MFSLFATHKLVISNVESGPNYGSRDKSASLPIFLSQVAQQHQLLARSHAVIIRQRFHAYYSSGTLSFSVQCTISRIHPPCHYQIQEVILLPNQLAKLCVYCTITLQLCCSRFLFLKCAYLYINILCLLTSHSLKYLLFGT